MNQYYSAELSQKVKRGMRELRLKGIWQGGLLPYGYKVVNKKICIKDVEAENVKYIFSQAALGVGASKIINYLDRECRLNTGRKLSNQVIYQMLRNTRYMGWYKKGDELVDNMFPKIIEKELFYKVQNRIKRDNKGKRSEKTVYLLRNKIKCGYCGENINGDTGTSYNGEKKHYYTCVGKRTHSKDCIKTAEQQKKLESEILDAIISQLSIPENRDFIANKILSYQEEHLEKNEEIEILQKELASVKTSLQNLQNAVLQGIITKTTKNLLIELENREEEITKMIAKKQCQNITKLTKRDITKFLENALKEDAGTLIETLINKIILYNDKKEIYFNSPLKDKSPDDKSQDFLFNRNFNYNGQNSEIVSYYLWF